MRITVAPGGGTFVVSRLSDDYLAVVAANGMTAAVNTMQPRGGLPPADATAALARLHMFVEVRIPELPKTESTIDSFFF
jgi:hypothetical protein